MHVTIKFAAMTTSLLISLTASVAAQSTLERIKSEGKIVVGLANGAPWALVGPDGQATGFSPDLVRAAFEPLGIKKIEAVITEFGALIPALVSRRFDAVASGLYITPVRCKAVAFSDPDLSLKDALIVRQGNPFNIHSYEDIARNTKVTLGVDRGVANYDNAVEAGVPRDRIMQFQGAGGATLSALLAGRVDAATYSAPQAIAILRDRKIPDIERASPFTGVIKGGREKSGYSAIAFRPEDADLRDVYNKRLKEMKADGTVSAIMKKYGFTEAETAPELTQAQICATSE